MLTFILYKLGEFLACYLPSKLAYWIAEKIADFFFVFSFGKYKTYKEAVFHNLAIIGFKDKTYARDVFRNFARYIREFLWLGRISKRRFFREASLVGIENLDAALKKERGVLLLSCHFGNWEWGGIALSLWGYKMCFLVRPHTNVYTNDLFNNLRRKKGVEIIPTTNLKQVIVALRNNKVVAFLVDEANEGIKVKLCNKIITLASGPFKIAWKYGAIISPAFMIKDKKTGIQRGIIEPPIEVDSKLKMQESIKIAAQKFAKIMENYLSFYPDHWLLLKKKKVYSYR